MRICWDNLEEIEYVGEIEKWRKRYPSGKFAYFSYIDKCLYCNEPFLANQRADRKEYCTRSCCNKAESSKRNHKTGASNSRWKGHKIIREKYPGKKYVYVYDGRGKKNRRYEHVLIAEEILGRRLKKGECVHHIDMDGTNNSHDNLLICDNSYHFWLHQEMSRQWIKEHILNVK